ncbi:hypothetical protein L686_02260 [Stutzerimonas stutzeri MF28]|nr:hypothetical protein L686_02260 [Stutzerimonas stutzeri MF28]
MVEEKYGIDYTLIDLNPGLSAINQNLFLNSDVFAVPTNPDPFSIMALDTLKTTLPRWASWKQSAIDVFSDSAYPLRDGLPKFGGAFIQRFNVRNGRAAKPYRENITEIKSKITNELVPALHRAQMTFDMDMYPEELKSKGYCLEEIQDFGGLLPKAYSVGAPIFDLANHEIGETGPILEALVEKRDVLSRKIASAAEELVKLMNYA